MNDYQRLVQPGLIPELVDTSFAADVERITHVRRLERFAERLYKDRRKRSKHFDEDLFGEPVWDILLDLFICEGRGRPVSVTSVCIASGAPPTTALRYVSNLVAFGLLERRGDEGDARRVFVTLTEKGRSAMIACLEETMSG
ncbi:MarR family winged helix-turn-helix transcriptional regulator [Novosphingobium sp. PhB55]|uniref:MarR family winged helix-turn-helix transcriptional regulator n=1 Tax=Novosphingobium sp. PhB55 TaxID=2485106 RepID=UPI001AB0369E|nr:MarR family winged helix-turn-helix transcriptional regulator [Novosphingobium sp. PhB55]